MLRQAPCRAPGSPAAVSLGDRYAAGSERGKTGFHSAILVGQWHAVAWPASSVPGCARGRRWIPRTRPAPKPEPTVGACCKPEFRISSNRERSRSGNRLRPPTGLGHRRTAPCPGCAPGFGPWSARIPEVRYRRVLPSPPGEEQGRVVTACWLSSSPLPPVLSGGSCCGGCHHRSATAAASLERSHSLLHSSCCGVGAGPPGSSAQ